MLSKKNVWSQDALERQTSDEIGYFLPSMGQKVGVCVPSGCTVADAAINYLKVYKNIGATFTPQTGSQMSLTEDYFFKEYLEGNENDGFYNITPKHWTWGKWLYV